MNRAFLTSIGMVLGALAACGRPEAHPSRVGRPDSAVALTSPSAAADALEARIDNSVSLGDHGGSRVRFYFDAAGVVAASSYRVDGRDSTLPLSKVEEARNRSEDLLRRLEPLR